MSCRSFAKRIRSRATARFLPGVGAGGYPGCMVDHDLLERVLRLDADARRELRDALDRSLPVEVTPQLTALLDSRIAEADAHREDAVVWEAVRDRARAKVAAVTKTA